MNAVELGSKIKEARIAKKMTQSQVVGNFITRNMLSQIENGSAMPSVRTLEYLADVLDLPDILELSSGTDSHSPDLEIGEKHLSDSFSVLTSAKEAARDGDWLFIVSLEDSYPEEFKDEFQALLARAFLALAKDAAGSASAGSTTGSASADHTAAAEQASASAAASASYLNKAIYYSDCGLYANSSLKAEAVILLQQAAAYVSA